MSPAQGRGQSPNTSEPSPAAFEARLKAAADGVDAALESWEDEIEARDRIILEAMDAGMHRADVARWAKLTPARVTQVVARRAAQWSA